MSDAPPRRGVPLNLCIGLAWIGIYLLLMWHGGWDWEGRGALGFGMPKDASLERFGAPVPALVEAGDWQRLVLSAWLQRSLVGILLLLWFWASLGRSLVAMFGRARTWLLFLAGGVGGACAHAWAHAGSGTVGGAGPFDPILAALGARLLWGLSNKGPQASAVLRSTIVSLLLIGLLTWYFTRDAPDTAEMRALIGREAEIGALCSGALAMLLMGPRRVTAPAGGAVRGVALAGLLLVVGAGAVQAPKVLASARREATLRFLQQLRQTEYEAWHISRYPDRATPETHRHLARRLDDLERHELLDDLEGAAALRSYLATLRAYATGDVPDPTITETACRKAFLLWYEHYEKPLRAKLGLPPRTVSSLFWETP